MATRRIKNQKKQLVLLITFGLDEQQQQRQQPQQQKQQQQQTNTGNVNNKKNNNQTSNKQSLTHNKTVATVTLKPPSKLKNQLAKLGRRFARDKVTLAVVGVGDEAIRNKKGFEELLSTDMTTTTKEVSKTMKTAKTREHYLLVSDEEYILEVLYYSVKFSKYY